MQFTPQQLRGGQRYKNTARIGNWKEEIIGEEIESKEFLSKQLKSLNKFKYQNRINKCNQIVPHTYSSDGKIRYDDTIIIKHQSTETSLACDPNIDLCPPNKQYLVTGSKNFHATARNTFRIIRAPTHLQDFQVDNDDELKYGQSFLLACNQSLLVSEDGCCMEPTLYLSSLLRNYRTATRITNKQAVFLTTNCDADAIWIVSLPSKGKSFENIQKYNGDPVLSGDLFLLKHRSTNTCLTVNSLMSYQTDYGSDLEVITSPETSIGKLSLVEYELNGRGTSRTLRKPDLLCHEVMFVTSSHPRYAVDNRVFPEQFNSKDLLLDLSASIRSLGQTSFLELRKDCIDIDRGLRYRSPLSNNKTLKGQIDITDLREILSKKGINTTDSYYDELFDLFREIRPPSVRNYQRGNSYEKEIGGYINYKDFISRLRGKISKSRSNYLRLIYDDLLKDLNNIYEHLPLQELSNRFNPNAILIVQERGLNPNQFRIEYLEGVIDTIVETNSHIIVTFEGFLNYFSDLSSLIDSDEEFEEFIQSCFYQK